MSTNAPSRVHHRPSKADNILYQIDSSRFRLYNPNQDPPPINVQEDLSNQLPSSEDDDETQSLAEFAYESDLRNYLAKNLTVIEPGLKLYEDDGVTGIEFSVGGRYIDILAVDSKSDFVVIELKVSRGYDRVVGKLMRYMAWISKNQAEPEQQIRGVIVAREISDDYTSMLFSFECEAV